jgi:hypothetical protein
LVKRVEPAHPAAEAGILPGDIILKYNHAAVTSTLQLKKMVLETAPTTIADLEIMRFSAGKEVTKLPFKVKVGDKPLIPLREELEQFMPRRRGRGVQPGLDLFPPPDDRDQP